MKGWRGLALMGCALLPLGLGRAEDPPREPALAAPPESLERVSERGPVKVRVALEPARPVIGDSLSLTLEVEAELWYQPIGYRWAQSLGGFGTAESAQFMDFFNGVSSTSAALLARAERTVR